MAAFAPPFGRGTRGQHFTGFQYQPPGRQPFGLKVKSPRTFGPAPLPEGGPWGDRPKAYPGGKRQPRFRREQRAGWADAPLPGPAAQGAPILPGGQWRPGFGRESSGRPGRHPPLDALRFAELPTALPGGERRLGTGHETNGGPSRSPPAQPVALEGSRALPGQSLATFF